MRVKRIGPPGTFEWVIGSNPEVKEALHRMNNAIAKTRQGHGEYLVEIQKAFADYVKTFGDTIAQAYNARDIREGRSFLGFVTVRI
jgi:hypothetical protein